MSPLEADRSPTRTARRVCVQWPRLAPHHVARLLACHERFHGQGIELTAVETAGAELSHPGPADVSPVPTKHELLFPGRAFEELSPRSIHRRVTDTLDRIRPDAVAINSYSMPDALACLRWCRTHRRVAVLMTDSKEDDVPRKAWRERIKARLIRQFDAALVGGTVHRDYLVALGMPPSVVFLGYDVVDNGFFAARTSAVRADPGRWSHLPGLERSGPFLLASVRFIRRKNVEGLLEAYRTYRSKVRDPWPLVILGDGPCRPSVDGRLRGEGGAGVTLAGYRTAQEVPAYYGLAGAFVHAALRDQWGLVVNEAMASGLPVLVSEGAGCARELVREGENGFRFDPTRTDRLVELLRRVTSDEVDRVAMGARSRDLVAPWSPGRFAEALAGAVTAGLVRADRPLAPVAGLVLTTLRTVAPRVGSFHAVEH